MTITSNLKKCGNSKAIFEMPCFLAYKKVSKQSWLKKGDKQFITKRPPNMELKKSEPRVF